MELHRLGLLSRQHVDRAPALAADAQAFASSSERVRARAFSGVMDGGDVPIHVLRMAVVPRRLIPPDREHDAGTCSSAARIRSRTGPQDRAVRLAADVRAGLTAPHRQAEHLRVRMVPEWSARCSLCSADLLCAVSGGAAGSVYLLPVLTREDDPQNRILAADRVRDT